MDALVEARSVEMTFASGQSGRRANIHVLRKISFDVGYGETLGLVGESGSGKSTIGRIVVGLHEPTGGSLKLFGGDLLLAQTIELLVDRSLESVERDARASDHSDDEVRRDRLGVLRRLHALRRGLTPTLRPRPPCPVSMPPSAPRSPPWRPIWLSARPCATRR